MDEEEIISFKYNWLWIVKRLSLTILFFVSPLVYILLDYDIYGIILFGGFLLLVGGYWAMNNFRNALRQFMDKPAIVLTKNYFIDHTQDIKLDWNNINSILLRQRTHITSLTYILKDKKAFFKQIKNPFLRAISLKFNEVLPTFTNLESIKGKNEQILKKILEYKKRIAFIYIS